MKCPICEHEYPLTMREYFLEPFGRHTCPACKERFRLRLSASYVCLLVFSIVVVGGIPALVVGVITRNISFAMIAFAVFGLALGFPIDRWLDDNRRESVKC